MRKQPSEPTPELDRLLEEAKKLPPITEEELKEQAKSWVRGNKDWD